MKTAFYLLGLAGSIQAQKTIEGGLITQEFAPCDFNNGCGYQSKCCRFYLEEYDYSQNLCVAPHQLDASGQGFYVDTKNYPFPKYTWTCP